MNLSVEEKEDREKGWVFLNSVLREIQDLPVDIDSWIRDELCDQSYDKNENGEDSDMGSDKSQCQVCKVSWDTGRFTIRLLRSLRKKEVKRLCKKPNEKQSSHEKRHLGAYFSKKSICELICHSCRKKEFYYFKRLPKNKKKMKGPEGIISKSNEIASVNKEERNKEVENANLLLPKTLVQFEALGKNGRESRTLEERIAASITRSLSKNTDNTRKAHKQMRAKKGAESAQQKKLEAKWKQQLQKKQQPEKNQQPEKKQQLDKKLQPVQENKKKNKIKVGELKKVLLKVPEKKNTLGDFLSSLF